MSLFLCSCGKFALAAPILVRRRSGPLWPLHGEVTNVTVLVCFPLFYAASRGRETPSERHFVVRKVGAIRGGVELGYHFLGGCRNSTAIGFLGASLLCSAQHFILCRPPHLPVFLVLTYQRAKIRLGARHHGEEIYCAYFLFPAGRYLRTGLRDCRCGWLLSLSLRSF